MSLRKFVSLLLLVAFALTSVPAQAASFASSATLPTVVQEAGLIADGANLDVVPVTININQVTAGALEFELIDFQGTTGASNGTTLSITTNGKLTVGGNGILLTGSNEKALILTPPTGTKFVGLTHLSYQTNGVTLQSNGGLVTDNIGGSVANNVLPSLGVNGNAIIARVITEAGPSTYFGSGVTVPAGSIVAYFATADNATGTNPIGTSFSLNGFGLAANPTGESTGTLTGNLSATYEEPGAAAAIDEALGSAIADGATIAIAQIGNGSKLQFGMAANEDSQPNTVLGVLLSSAGNGVTISPAQVTSTSSASALKLDTDALYIRAAEASTGVYYQTPFATSEYSGTVIDVNGGVATFNKVLTNTTTFPNTSDALISVAFSVQDPTTGLAYASTDASIDVTALSLSLVGGNIDTDIRAALTDNNGGFLGSIIEPILDNGLTAAAEANTGIAVLYNGVSATSPLVVKDATSIDYTPPTVAMGLNALTAFTVVPSGNGTAAVSLAVAPFTDGIFTGSFVTHNGASATEARGTATNGLAAVATLNGVISTANEMTLSAALDGLVSSVDALYTPSEVTVRLLDTTNGANAWFVITGNHAGNDLTDGVGEIRVGPSNSATTNGAIVQSTSTSAVGIADNAIAVARLSGNTLQILPIINHIDGARDAMIIRPEISLTIKTTTARTNGAKVVAVASGNNLTSTTTTVAQVTGVGSLDADIIVKAVAVNGAGTSLMVENGIDAFNGRALLDISVINGDTTSLDNYTDLIDNGNGLVLDETLPSLFCGGTIGDGEKGPNSVVSQARPMGILISENGQAGATTGVDAFSTVADNSNTVIRVTLPSGWDINKFSATQGEILNAFATGGLTSFDVADFDIQGINTDTGVSQAYVDISGFSLATPTVPMDRSFVLVFKQDALVAPVGVSDFTATITMVYDNGTSTTADDTLLASLGTVDLGTECATGLTLGFCADTISNGSTVVSDLESDLTSNGANLTTFSSTPAGALRIVRSVTQTETVILPDLCVGEGSADLFSVGLDIEGGHAAAGELYIFPSTTSTNTINFATAGDVSATDNSLTLAAATVASTDLGASAGDELKVAITDASNTLRPDEVTSRIRISRATLKGPDATIYPAQDLLAIFVDPNDTGAAIGDAFPMYYYENTANGDAITGRGNANNGVHMAAHFYNADVLDGTPSVSPQLVFNGDDAQLSFAFLNTTAPIITSAVTSIIDNDNYDQLQETDADIISVSVSDITGSTSKKVIVSAPAGTLEPNSTLSVSPSGSGSTDAVTVPVLADGSFQATVTADTTQTLILTQTPSSGRTDLSPQILELSVADANVSPTLLSATIGSLGIGIVPAKGDIPVVVTVTATGKVNGDTYVPVASELTIGGSPATAVTGTTDKFIALVDPAQTIVVESSAGSGSSVVATGLDATAITKGGKPNLFKKAKNDKNGLLVIRGKRLGRTDGSYLILKADGTVTNVVLRDVTRGDKKKNRRKSETSVTIPSNALYGIFISPSRGVDAELIIDGN